MLQLMIDASGQFNYKYIPNCITMSPIETMDSPTETSTKIVEYLQSKKNVPMSIRKIGKSLGIKNRTVFSICMDHHMISKVHPSHVGCGRDSGNLFVVPFDDKWTHARGSMGGSRFD